MKHFLSVALVCLLAVSANAQQLHILFGSPTNTAETISPAMRKIETNFNTLFGVISNITVGAAQTNAYNPNQFQVLNGTNVSIRSGALATNLTVRSDFLLPGFGAVSNYVWTLTNDVTGQGEWRAQAAGGGVSSSTNSYNPDQFSVANGTNVSIKSAANLTNSALWGLYAHSGIFVQAGAILSMDPASQLVLGQGSPVAGHVWTAQDGDGLGAWAAPAGGSSTGTNAYNPNQFAVIQAGTNVSIRSGALITNLSVRTDFLLPGYGAVSNYVWTATNATTGQGEWRARDPFVLTTNAFNANQFSVAQGTNVSIKADVWFTNAVNYGNAISSPGSQLGSEQFGSNAVASAPYGLAAGYAAQATGYGSATFGANAAATATAALALGGFSVAAHTNAVAVGTSASANHQNSVALGNQSATTDSNQVMIGTSAIEVVTPGHFKAKTIRLNSMTNDFILMEEFDGATFAGRNAWQISVAAGGVATENGQTNRPGIMALRTGTATGRQSLFLGGLVSTLFGNGSPMVAECAVFVSHHSDGVNTTVLRVGHGDNTGAGSDFDDGVYFQHDSTSQFWLCKTANNSTRTTSTSIAAVTTNVWNTLRYEVDGAGTNVVFFVNGAPCATNTLNIPVSIGRESGPIIKWEKTAGTLETTNRVDFFYAHQKLVR